MKPPLSACCCAPREQLFDLQNIEQDIGSAPCAPFLRSRGDALHAEPPTVRPYRPLSFRAHFYRRSVIQIAARLTLRAYRPQPIPTNVWRGRSCNMGVFQPVGGFLTTSPALVAFGQNSESLFAFSVGKDQALWFTRFDGFFRVGEVWNDWQSLGGPSHLPRARCGQVHHPLTSLPEVHRANFCTGNSSIMPGPDGPWKFRSAGPPRSCQISHLLDRIAIGSRWAASSPLHRRQPCSAT